MKEPTRWNPTPPQSAPSWPPSAARQRTPWGALEKAKAKAVAAGSKALSPTSPEYVALKAAGTAYDRVRDELASVEAAAAVLRDGPGLTAADHARMATGFDTQAALTGLRAWRNGQVAFAGEGKLVNIFAPLEESGGMPLVRRTDFRNAVASLSVSPISPKTRLPGIETGSGPTLDLLSRIPVVPSESTVFQWMLETVGTTPAVETDEGVDVSLASEATLTYAPQDGQCLDVDVTLPVSTQVLADDDAFEAFLAQRLGLAVMQRIQSQAISGAGSGSGELLGLLNTPNILTQDMLGSYSTPDLVARAVTKYALRHAPPMSRTRS